MSRDEALKCMGESAAATFVSDARSSTGGSQAYSFAVMVPLESPIHPITKLADGWDGYRARKPSAAVIEQAQEYWQEIDTICDAKGLPQVSPGRDNIICFSWSQHEPRKRLDIFVGEKQTEWIEERDGQETDGSCVSNVGLLRVVRKYLRY